MIPLAERRLAQVSWVDATNVAGGWFDVGDLAEWADNGAWNSSNTGWIVHEDDSCYVLSGRMTDDGKNAGLIERIPKRAVTGIRFFVPEAVSPMDQGGLQPPGNTLARNNAGEPDLVTLPGGDA